MSTDASFKNAGKKKKKKFKSGLGAKFTFSC
jgi:hypothetical protein